MLFDAHLHLADEYKETNEESIRKLITDAKIKGVERFISNSINIKTNLENISLAKVFDSVFLGMGIYPTEFKSEKDLDKLNVLDLYSKFKSNLKAKTLIGEIGLDFKFSTKDEQEFQYKGFEQQIDFAIENDLFVEIHSRFAIKQTLNTLIEKGIKKVIMHWYTTSRKYATKAVDAGYFITVGPSLLYNTELVWNNIKDLPFERILFETDFPVSFSNELQTPATIRKIAEKYAELKGLSMEELEKQQEKNFKLIFPRYL